MTIISCLFELLRYSIWNSDECRFDETVDMKAVLRIAQFQGVEAILFDGIERFYNQGIELNVDVETKLEWISDIQQTEAVYEHHKNVITQLAKFYQQHGIKMMLMKGIGLGYDYPVPKHRPCGDIDIYLYGDLEKGDNLIQEQLGLEIDKSQHKHTIFHLEEVTVENHYDFANYHKHKSSKKIDDWLKKEVENSIKIDNNIWLPSPNFNAVFLLRHSASHFAAEQITLRHLLDWAFFVENHYDEVDWEWHWNVCKEQNMHRFLLAINNICVQYLGFDASLFRTGGDVELTKRVLQEILQPEFQEDNPKHMLPYIMSRGRRWWANRWKHNIVYPEGMVTTFFSQVSAHLKKPATLHR